MPIPNEVTMSAYATSREITRQHPAAGGHSPPTGTTMLLWINGPCGVGKTATAFELNRRLPGSVVCDPAHVGVDGPMRAWLHRYVTTARQIRWG